jgi:hypothetical protein
MAPSRIHAFLRLPSADRALLVRSGLLLGAARVALWLFPFNVVRRALAPRRSSRSQATTEKIGWAISVAARLVPRADCLPQALVAESLLLQSGHPVELRIGVVKTEREGFEAHAWVESGGRVVVGDLTQGLSSFTPLPPLPGGKL